MCTLIVLDRRVPGVPVVAASNRDEYLARAAAPPSLIPPASPGGIELVAPQDLESGGTWMGVNARGVFVGLTNQPIAERDPSKRSRGLLVLEALGCPTAREAFDHVKREARGRYNPFHLLCADGRGTFVASLLENGLSAGALEPGLHVLSNRGVNEASCRKTARVRESLEGLDPEAPLGGTLDRLRRALGLHGPEGEPLLGTCVHRPEYGTRSSALVALGERRWRLWQAEGPPCTTKYQNYTRLLDGLRQA